MHINELEKYNLGDAVKLHQELNPELFSGEELRPDVREALLKIADDFREYLGISSDQVDDITLSGSNAAYTYTPYSDIDLHLIIDMSRLKNDEVYRELFDAKKSLYNDRFDIRVKDYDVELYVQEASDQHHSAGIYSIQDDRWLRIPRRQRNTVDDAMVQAKYQQIGTAIEQAIKKPEYEKLSRLFDKIKRFRKSGLEKTGEFGPENLTFKLLRNKGLIKKLAAARDAAKSQDLSIDESNKKDQFRWGFAESASGYIPSAAEADDPRFITALTVDIKPNSLKKAAKQMGFRVSRAGIPPRAQTNGKLLEGKIKFQGVEGKLVPEINRAIPEIIRALDLKQDQIPPVTFTSERSWAKDHNTFGVTQWQTSPEDSQVFVYVGDRYLADVLRTFTHELRHVKQFLDGTAHHEMDQREHDHAEADANTVAGKVVHDYGKKYNKIFTDLNESFNQFKKLTTEARGDYVIGKPQSLRLMGVPIEHEEQIKDVLERYLKVQAPNATEATKAAIEMMAKRPQSRLSDIVLGDLELIVDKFSVPIGNFYRAMLDHALYGYYQNPTELKEDIDLFEVKMSPGELQKWAASDDASGIQAGFEAELIFRDTARDDGGDEEYEPDYDQDERAHSIDQVVEFFQGGDNGISSRTARNLSTALQEEYYEWRDEAIYDEWSNVAEEQVEDYMETNVWGDDNTQDQYREQAAERLGIETSEESAERADEIEQLAREIFKEDIQDQIENEGNYYDDAREYFRDMAADSGDYDEDAFLSDRYRYMTDIADAHNIDWPYWTGGESSGAGGREPQGIADSLRSTLNLAGIDNTGVVAGGGYHSTARKPGRWIIEPDGSLDPDDYEDAGLEVVSPPMPLPEAMRALRTVIDWANSSEGDAYTNSSTGLHMGISIPHKGGKVDYVKLVLFMGDQHVLDQFDRAANTYCASALEKLRQTQIARRRGLREQDTRSMTGAEKTAAAMDLMRKNLVELAQRYVQDGVGQSKYTSAHIKDGYIEFRSPGGDYLSMDSRDEQALGNTMLRFARAMYLAGRPDLERREYSKKLYKLLSGFRSAETARDTKRDTKYRTHIETEGANDALELFAKYSSGMINSEELKKQWAEQVLAKEAPPTAGTGRFDSGEYEIYLRHPDGRAEIIDTIKAENEAEAEREMLRLYRDSPNRWHLNLRPKEVTADPGPEKKLSRRAEIAKRLKERPSIWRVTDTNTGQKIIVSASDTRSAKFQAADSGGEHWKILRANDPDSMLVEPASAAEVKQYQEKMADQQQDSAQVQQRVQGLSTTGSARYRVSWTERRDGEEIQDSLNIEAPSAEAARDLVRRALEAQGRDVVMRGDAQLVGSTQDLAQQRAAQAEQPRRSIYTGQWTGRWQVKNANTGKVVYTFTGAGNNQGDANRIAQRWVQQTRYDDPVEVVPEMG